MSNSVGASLPGAAPSEAAIDAATAKLASMAARFEEIPRVVLRIGVERAVQAAYAVDCGAALEAGPRDELLTRLRSLLETFGEHLPDCERPDKSQDEGCTCGFRLNLMAVRDLVPYSHGVRGESLPEKGE